MHLNISVVTMPPKDNPRSKRSKRYKIKRRKDNFFIIRLRNDKK